MSESLQERLPELSRTGFEGLKRDELVEVANYMGVEFPKTANTETLRNLLCAAVGYVRNTSESIKVAAAQTQATGVPNLTHLGEWGGRRRRVTLLRDERTKGWKGYPISWEGEQRYFHFGTPVDMPYPYYEILKNMVNVKIICTDTVVGGKPVAEYTEEARFELQFSDGGDTPGTEHLPRSLVEYFQQRAAKEDNFRKADRRVLVDILNHLLGQGDAARFVAAHKQDDEALRDRVLTFLGINPLALAA